MSDSGGRPQSVTDEEIVRYFRRTRERVLTTREVAEDLDVSRRTALRRLSELAEAGTIRRKDVGERRAVWWLPGTTPAAVPVPDDDPFLTAETFSSGQTSVSESVDEHVAASIRAETDE